MLAVPLLLGIAATALSPWHALLMVAAIAGYLLVATTRAWLRSGRRELAPSLGLYGAAFAATAAVLVVVAPPLLLAGLVAVPAGLLVALDSRSRSGPRGLAVTGAQVVLALVLVPAAGVLSGAWDAAAITLATAVAAGYLVGTVLVVRSVIRERGNRDFAGVSVAFHVACTIAAIVALPWPYALCFGGLACRAAALPLVERRAARGARGLRPVHVGMVEMVASVALVVVAFAVPL
jgi:hypothetical protein